MKSVTSSSSSAELGNQPQLSFLRLLFRGAVGLALGFGGMAWWNLAHRPGEPPVAPKTTVSVAAGSNARQSEAFQKRLASLPESASRDELSVLAGEWMAADPAAAIAWMRSLPSSFDKELILAVQAGSLLSSSKDLPHALQVIESMSRSTRRGMLELDYVQKLADKDAAGAAAYAKAHFSGSLRIEALQNVACKLLASDLRGALDLVKKEAWADVSDTTVRKLERKHKDGGGSSSTGVNPLETIYKAACEKFPRDVLELFSKSGETNSAGYGVHNMNGFTKGLGQYAKQALINWFSANPAEVTDWFRLQPASVANSKIGLLLAHQLAGSDPAAAKAFALAQPEGLMREGALAGLATNLASAPELIPWLQTQGESCKTNVRRALSELANTNPTLAAQHFPLLNPQTQARCQNEILDGLVNKQPEQMVSFFNSLPVASQAQVNLIHTTQKFANQDPAAASRWVDSLPTSYAKDSAIGGLINYLTSEALEPDFAAAAVWANSASPQKSRTHLSTVAQAWKQQDPHATTAISQSNLPENVKTTLLEYVTRKP